MNKTYRMEILVWLTLLLVVFIVTLTMNRLSRSVTGEMENEYVQYQYSLAQSSAKSLRLFFTEISSEIRLLSRTPAFQNLELPQAAEELKQVLDSHNKLVSDILFISREGKFMIDPAGMSLEPEYATQLFEILNHLPTAVDLDKYPSYLHVPLITDIGFGRKFEGIVLAVPVYLERGEYRGQLIGSVMAVVDKSRIERNLLDPIQINPSSAAFIVTHKQMVLEGKDSRERVASLIRDLNADPQGKEIALDIARGGSKNIWWEMKRPLREDDRSLQTLLLSYSAAQFAEVTWSVVIMTPRDVLAQYPNKISRQASYLSIFITVVMYLGVVFLVRNNRKRVVAQEEARHTSALAEKNRELEQLNKMKDEFVSIVSHDLRSPVSTIYSYAQLMVRDEKDPKKERFLNAIMRSTERLLTLVNDILDLARVEAGEMKLNISDVDIDTLVHESFKAIQFNADQKSIELEYKHEDGPATVKADNSKLYQVLNNLIGNAIKFSPERSRIVVSKSEQDGNLLFSVKDNGHGLTEEEQKVVFERFRQAGNHAGSGLGLAICKNMVELHGGRIWVESAPGEGADFLFTIPLTPPSGVKTDG